jgi:DNA polymerase III subunit alpha
MSDFVHLHVHSQYSLLDGLSKFPHLLERVAEYKQKAIALTDHGAMYGAVHFYNQATKAGIKPIIGVETYMAENSRFDKQSRMGQDAFHLTLLAKDITGYLNLMKLVSYAHLEGYSYRPRIDFELLEKYHQGIIATSGCSSAIIPKKILENKEKSAVKWLKKFHALFQDDFYIEIQSHPQVDVVEHVRPRLIKLAHDYGVPLVATNDVHYVDAEDAEAQDALLAIQTRKTIADTNRLSMLDSPDFYLKSTDEMCQAFPNQIDALENSVKIANLCSVTIPTGKMIFPDFPLNPGETPESALRKLSHDKLLARYHKPSNEIVERLDYELDIICNKGYASYFLIVQDFVNWAKSQGIRVGPGRGSAAGSLVSYSLRITSIDPLVHSLPFERFMNPQRPSPPDIDIDIADEHRDQVIRYTAEKYGEDHVAQVITFGTMEARAAIRDIGRVLGMPFSEPDKVAKLIPVGSNIEEALINVFELQEMYKDPRYKKLLDLAKKVEGSARHASTHAAAVVIADKPLTSYTPIQRETKGGKIVTQYDMYALDLNISDDAIGLLKMDFLGLRNLSILGQAIEQVKKETGITVDLSEIPLDEPKVYQMLSLGETTGVFQLESAGMRRVARKLEPNRFSDITAMVALYRPGPMELIDDFIAGKKDQNKIKYPHPALKPVLEETYGIPVYQEQVLQIANVFAGYSLGEADILRRAIGKKKKSILDKEKKRFIKGAEAKGYTAKSAETIWGFIEKFAGYGFNKAHSASYAMIAYQTAYMKAIYPVEYMTALLSIESKSHSVNKDEKVSLAIDECRRMGIVVLPPDINLSQEGFSIETHPGSLSSRGIRYGLNGIKNVGEAAIESIVKNRSIGIFASVTDFTIRVDTRKVNKKVLESLTKTGAFDRFGSRASILQALDDIKNIASAYQQKKVDGQGSLFDAMDNAPEIDIQDKLPAVPDLKQSEKLKYEKELLGIYLTDHPHADTLAKMTVGDIIGIGSIDPHTHVNSLKIAGIIRRIKVVYTKKNNQPMAFVTLEDTNSSIEVVIFPKLYDQIKESLVEDQPVIVTGKLDKRDDRVSLIADKLTFEIIGSGPGLTSNSIEFIIPERTDPVLLKQVGSILKNKPGATPVVFKYQSGNKQTELDVPYQVDADSELIDTINRMLGNKK